ncbi:MAG: hypothetical protein WBA93_29010 [Microcoleaceae cyanobacterium]
MVGLKSILNQQKLSKYSTVIVATSITEEIRSKASPFKGIKKAVEGWRGLLAISRPRQEHIPYVKPLALAKGTDN